MSGTLNANYIQSDLGTNLYLNTGIASGNVTIGNTSALIVNTISANTVTANIVTTNAITIGTTAIGAGDASIMKNRIINGAMVVAQRGTSAVTADGSFPVDRFQIQIVNANLSLVQSSTAPAGFNYSTAITITSTTSSAVTDRSRYFQLIEGYNIADLAWGTANAKTVTVSFWAQSTVAGTYSGNITNATGNRSFVFTYTLAANTWTYVTAVITGDTTGTWGATNNTGICVNPITLNCGSNYQGAAGSWIAGDARGTSGSTYLATSNSGAVFYVTGVQLEVGSSATGFEYVNYQTSLANCQRYYETTNGTGTMIWTGDVTNTQNYYLTGLFSVQKRASPTFTATIGSASGFGTTVTDSGATTNCWDFSAQCNSTGARRYFTGGFTASAEL